MIVKHKDVNFNVIVRSTVFWSIMAFSTIFYNLMAMLIIFTSVRNRHAAVVTWSKLFVFLSKHLCKVTYEVHGAKNIIKGPAVISSNHQSMWETMAYSVIFPSQVPILKRELLYIPFFGWTLRTISPIAIDRSKRSGTLGQIYRQGKEKISHGFWLLVFPEGTRAAPDKVLPYKTGVVKIAQHLDIPIVPVAHNAGHCMPKSSFWVFPGHIDVVVDQPIYVDKEASPEQVASQLENWTKQEIQKLI